MGAIPDVWRGGLISGTTTRCTLPVARLWSTATAAWNCKQPMNQSSMKGLLEGTIPHPGQLAGTVMGGAQPVDAVEQMLVADPYRLEMMWNKDSVLIDTANLPGQSRGSGAGPGLLRT